jgi:uncharacterized protein
MATTTTTSMTTAFADTGAWIAVMRPGDRHHDAAVAHLQALNAAGMRLLTSNYVLDEAATRLRYDMGLRAALGLRERVIRGTEAGYLRVSWVDPATEEAAWALLEERPELKLSLTDATSAVIARKAKVGQIFGFDADFRALGFELLPGA